MNKCLPPGDSNAAYPYCASLPAAILFSILFGLTTLFHIFQGFRYRKCFTWVITMAALWETVGLITRALSTLDQSQTTYLIPSQLLVLLAPLWVNAFDYMLLGRMVHFFVADRKVAGIRADRLARWFVIADITAFIVQGGGASLTTSTNPKTMLLGIHIYMGGIGLQQCFIFAFLALAITFHKRMNRGEGIERHMEWRKMLYVLYATLGLITLRIIYRLLEWSIGIDSVLTMHEAWFYCLDALLMFCAIALYNVVHPGMVLVGPESEFINVSKEEKRLAKEEKRAAKEAKKNGLNGKHGNVGVMYGNIDMVPV